MNNALQRDYDVGGGGGDGEMNANRNGIYAKM